MQWPKVFVLKNLRFSDYRERQIKKPLCERKAHYYEIFKESCDVMR
jgi:hypothetical protein